MPIIQPRTRSTLTNRHYALVAESDLIEVARQLITPEIAEEIAVPYSDTVVFPARHIVEVGGSSKQFPGWDGRVLVLSVENQGVCSWGLSLDGGDAGQVVVGGNLPSGVGTVVYATGVADFVAARRWDARLFGKPPLLQAQAIELDEATLRTLRSQFVEGITTFGWPCATNYRFESDTVALMLWACSGQCDWWVSGGSTALAGLLPTLRQLSDLGTSLWSNDAEGARLLGQS